MKRIWNKLVGHDEWVTPDKFKPSKAGLKRWKDGKAVNVCICEQKWIGSRNVTMNLRFKINPNCPVHGE